MKRLGRTANCFMIMNLIFVLMLWWVPAGWADETNSAAAPEPEKPQWNAGVDFLSQYVWRGIALSRKSGVMQPSFTGSYKGVLFNAWTNIDFDEQNPYGRDTRRGCTWNETDLTFSYGREVFPNFSLTGGLIWYLLDGNNSSDNSVEIFGTADYTLPWFNIGVSVYREVSHFPGTFLQWYIHRAIDIPWLEGMNLDLMASWSAEFSNDKAAYPVFDSVGEQKNEFYQSLHVGYLGVTLNIPVGKYVVVAPKIQYWYGLGGESTATLNALSWDAQHNHILGGVNLAVNF
jgi:hypothetical protein